jgi:hypothetical protein
MLSCCDKEVLNQFESLDDSAIIFQILAFFPLHYRHLWLKVHSALLLKEQEII